MRKHRSRSSEKTNWMGHTMGRNNVFSSLTDKLDASVSSAPFQRVVGV
jgi:hypothetical protein